MFWFWANVQGGLDRYHLLDIPMVFFVISQIIFNMFDINVYSIIDSRVFSVTFGVDFPFPIVE